MRTLADMTPEELARCKGMWCEDEDGRLCIYRADHRGANWLAICIYPDRGDNIASVHSRLTPLPDLPRDWNPDGQPVPGEWETYREVGIGETFLREERRWVGEWEEA